MRLAEPPATQTPQPRRAMRAAALVLLAYAACVPVAAAAQAGTLTVHVTGPAGAVQDARVQLTGPDGTIRSLPTGPDGRAAFGRVAAGAYRLEVSAFGYRTTRREIEVTHPTVPPIRMVLEALPIALEALEVTAARIGIQRETTDFSTTVGAEALRLLPLTGDAAEAVALVPGARAGHVWGGANFQANSYRLDGMPATHPGLGGSLIDPSLLWVERLEVKGLGAGAETGGFQGGQVNFITKRGSNEFGGTIRTRTEHHALSATNLVASEIGSEMDFAQEIEGEVGGPLVRDRVYYYLGGSWSDVRARYLNHLPGIESRYSPVLEARRKAGLFGKLTWEPGAKDRLELSGAVIDTRVENHGATGYEALGAASRLSAPSWLASAAWRRAWGKRSVFEARLAHFERDERQDPYGGIERPGIRFFSLVPPYAAFGNAAFALRSAPSSSTLVLENTIRLTGWGGDHLLKIGGEYMRGRFLDRRTRNGGMTWLAVRTPEFDADDPATWSHSSQSWIPTEWGGEVHLDAQVMNAAVFAQGSVSLGRLVLSPGVRWGVWQGWLDPVAGEPFRAVRDQAVDPRIGATLELTQDGSAVVKAHWGRYHQDLMTQMFDRAAGSDAFTNQEIWYYRGEPSFDSSQKFTLAQRDSLAALGQFTLEGVTPLNETGLVLNYRQPYVDQWLLGLEKQFGSMVKVEALYTERANRNMVALVDRNRATNYTRIDRVLVFPAGGERPIPFEGIYTTMSEVYIPNDVLISYLRECAAQPDLCDPSPVFEFADTVGLTWDPDYMLTTAPDARRVFRQLQLTVEVARPRWGGSFSVALTSLKGNLDNVTGYADPALFGPGPYVRVNEGVNSWGYLPNFSTRELKVSSWAVLPWDLHGGLVWTYQSGDHFSPQFQISALGFYEYRVNQKPVDRWCLTGIGPDGQPLEEPCPPDQWGDPLPIELLRTLEGHRVFIGPRGKPAMERRSNFDVRLERPFTVRDLDLAATLTLFNIFGKDHVTRVQAMVNNGRDVEYLIPGTDRPHEWTPLGGSESDYFGAALERVRPRSLRVGLTLSF